MRAYELLDLERLELCLVDSQNPHSLLHHKGSCYLKQHEFRDFLFLSGKLDRL